MQANSIATAVLFSCLLLAASVWDIRKRTIPDILCIGIAAIGLFTFSPVKLLGILPALLLLGAALLWGGGTGMGGGDIKLTAASGFAEYVGSVGHPGSLKLDSCVGEIGQCRRRDWTLTIESRHGTFKMLLLIRRIGQRRGATRAACEVWQRGDFRNEVAPFFVATLENQSDKPRGLGQSPNEAVRLPLCPFFCAWNPRRQ